MSSTNTLNSLRLHSIAALAALLTAAVGVQALAPATAGAESSSQTGAECVPWQGVGPVYWNGEQFCAAPEGTGGPAADAADGAGQGLIPETIEVQVVLTFCQKFPIFCAPPRWPQSSAGRDVSSRPAPPLPRGARKSQDRPREKSAKSGKDADGSISPADLKRQSEARECHLLRLRLTGYQRLLEHPRPDTDVRKVERRYVSALIFEGYRLCEEMLIGSE
jgi:hypothetical protein